jgi:WD40 repeat protein
MSLPTQSGVRCEDEVNAAVVYSPNGKVIAESLCNKGVKLIDAGTGRVIRQFAVPTEATAVAYSPNGQLLAVGTDNFIQLRDPATGAVLGQLPCLGTKRIEFSPNGKTLAVAGGGTAAALFDVASHHERVLLSNAPNATPSCFCSVAFTPNSRLVIVGSSKRNLFVFLVTSGDLVRRVPIAKSAPTVVAVSPNGTTFAVGTNTNSGVNAVTIYNLHTWKLEYRLTSFSYPTIDSIDYSPDGGRIAIAAADGLAGVWSLATKTEVVPLPGLTADTGAVAWNAKGDEVATVSDNGAGRVWSGEGNEISQYSSGGPGTSVEGGVLLAHRVLALTTEGNDIALVTLAVPSLKPIGSYEVGTNANNETAALSPDGKLVAVADWQTNQLTVSDVATHGVVNRLNVQGEAPLTFSDNDRYLAAAEPTNLLVDLKTGEQIDDVQNDQCYNGSIVPSSFSANNEFVASATYCGQVHIYRVTTSGTGTAVESFETSGLVSSVSLNPSGQRLAVASWNGDVTVWDTATGRLELTIESGTGGIDGVAYTPSGHDLVTTSIDKTVRVWDAGSGDLLQVDDDGAPLVSGGFALNSTGSQIVTVDFPGVVNLWDTCADCGDVSSLLVLAKQRVVSQLTPLELLAKGP